MSYTPSKSTGDSLNDWFTRIAEFMNISPNLLSASSPDSFEVWFEKMELIDKRSLYFFLKENRENIPEQYLDMVKSRFPKEI